MPNDPLRDQLQTTLGTTYTLEHELGGGGMSRVFIATETRLKRKVVVKVLSPELAAGVSAERFQREIELAASLQQANIVPLLSAGDTDGLPYFTMPFVDGLSLRARIERNGALPVAEAVSVIRDVSRALAYAHEAGVVHRDIKPENILLSGDAAVVTDFGIAKALSASRTAAPGGTLTQVGTSIGTPAYMAPEQAAGDPATDHRADLYALGCVAYEMLTGASPFAGRPVHQLFAAHLNEAPTPIRTKRADVPPTLASLVMRLLEKDPARRPQSAREVLQSLDSVTTSSNASGSQASRTWAIAAAAVILVVVAVGAMLTFKRNSASPAGGENEHSIAVLPFSNPGGDTAQAYFAAGMADELTSAIGKVPGLRVASRSAAIALENKGLSVQDIGRTLHVGAVLEGSVRRAGGKLRVTAQLTNVKDGLSIWSDAFERDVGDVFTAQDELSRRIAQALREKLAVSAGAATMVTARGTTNQDAYDLYLRGRYLWERRGEASLLKASSLFGDAVKRDPAFARAWAALAMVQVVLPQYLTTPVDSIIPTGIRNARHAIALDSTIADGYLALAYGQLATLEWTASDSNFRHALALEPQNPTAHHWYADLLYPTGRLDEALAEFKTADRLDPTSAVRISEISNLLYLMRRYGESIAMGHRAMEMDSTLALVYSNFALSYVFTGHPDSAVFLLRRSQQIPGAGFVSSILPFALTSAGHPDEATKEANAVEDFARHHKTSAFNAATARFGVGDREGALRWMTMSVDRRESDIAVSAPGCDPMFDVLHADPRFVALIRRMGGGLCTVERPAR